jgi:hypothetical protein
LICHTSLPALTIFALTSAMILTSLGAETLFITAIGFATLQTPGLFSAAGTAIPLAAIAVAADVKHAATRRKVANQLVKDRARGSRHGFCEGVDNPYRSWQDDDVACVVS